MNKFIEKHPVVSGILLYSLVRGLLVEVAEAIKPEITVIFVEPADEEDIPTEN